jgi:hypothetical protein
MMGGFGFQDLLVAVLALAAVAWLVRRRLRQRERPTPFCGDCPGCRPAHHLPVPPPVRRDDLIPVSRLTGRRS